jgi:ParB family transcriptional regulator, chromosome partitioning protein
MKIIEQHVAFGQISGISPLNVRQADAGDDVSSLKATIHAVGLINPLLLHPAAPGQGGGYLVLAGGRRWRALSEIAAETGDRQPDIRVKIVENASDAELISLSTMENTQTLAMHPARQFEAFAAIAHALPSEAQAIEVIAREFGLTRHHVRQRLALGNLSPKIRAAWLEGKISAEAAKAYAEGDDIAAQEAFFDSVNDGRQSDVGSIRRALLGDWINGDDPLAKFVGAEAYAAAGYELRDSLFAEEQRFKKPLLEKLAHEKLHAAAAIVKHAELWGFIVTEFDDGAEECEQVEDLEPDYLPEEEARLAAIRAELQGKGTGDERRALECEAAAIEAKAICRALPMAERLTLGLYADIDWRGDLKILRAVARPTEEVAPAEAVESDADEDNNDDAPTREKTPRVEKPAPLPPAAPIGKQLRTVLDETAAAALHGATMRSVNVALIFAVAKLGCSWGGDVVNMTLHGRRNWTPARELLLAIAHEKFDKALALVAAAPLNDMTTAFCELVGASIDPARNEKFEETLGLIRAAAGVGAIHMDMIANFSPELYFHAATRDAMISAIREMAGEAAAAEAGKLGKPALCERATILARDNKWLPAILREAAMPAESAHPAQGEEPPKATSRTMDERTTIQAMADALNADEAATIDPDSALFLVKQFFAAHMKKAEGAMIDYLDLDDHFYDFNLAKSGHIFETHEVREALQALGVEFVAPSSGRAYFKGVKLVNIDGGAPVAAEPTTDIDRVNRFLIDRCTLGVHAKDIKASILAASFAGYAASRGWPNISGHALATALEALGFEKHRLGKGVRYKNLSLRDSPSEAAQ